MYLYTRRTRMYPECPTVHTLRSSVYAIPLQKIIIQLTVKFNESLSHHKLNNNLIPRY